MGRSWTTSFELLTGSSVFDSCQHDVGDPTSSDDAANLVAAEAALIRLKTIFPDNSFELPTDFPKFERSELSIGSRLGQGSFSFVDEIKKINLLDKSASALSSLDGSLKQSAKHLSLLDVFPTGEKPDTVSSNYNLLAKMIHMKNGLPWWIWW